MANNKNSGTTLTSHELGHGFQEQQVERHKDPTKWRGLSFGHPDLDRVTGGARRKEFIVMAGAQKAGKTTIALAMVLNFAKQLEPDEEILFISLEMSHDAIAGKVLSNLADIDVSRFRDYELKDTDWSKLEYGVGELDKLNVLWNVGAFTMEGIEAIVAERKGKLRVVVIDYFQLLQGGGNEDTRRWEQLEGLSRFCKRISMNYSLTVLAISQQSREALKNPDKQKDPNTLAGTQSLARDCDMLLIITPYTENGEEVPHMRKLHIALSRNSAMDVTLDACFFAQNCRFGAPIADGFPIMSETIKPETKFWYDN